MYTYLSKVGRLFNKLDAAEWYYLSALLVYLCCYSMELIVLLRNK